jgi:hypothetical protein
MRYALIQRRATALLLVLLQAGYPELADQYLRLRVGNPACHFCAVWVPGAVGERSARGRAGLLVTGAGRGSVLLQAGVLS